MLGGGNNLSQREKSVSQFKCLKKQLHASRKTWKQNLRLSYENARRSLLYFNNRVAHVTDMYYSYFTERFNCESRLMRGDEQNQQITFHGTKITHFTRTTDVNQSQLTKIPFTTHNNAMDKSCIHRLSPWFIIYAIRKLVFLTDHTCLAGPLVTAL